MARNPGSRETGPASPTRYLLLMRHVAGIKPFHLGEDDKVPSPEHPAILRSGETAAIAVADRLRESIDEAPPDQKLALTALWVAPSSEAVATASIVAAWVAAPEPRIRKRLAPEAFVPTGGAIARERLKALTDQIDEWRDSPGAAGPPALLIVGHDPQLGWIADRLTGGPVPIDRGELVCLGYRAVPTSRLGRLLESAKPRTRRRSSHGWQLEWSIHPDDRKAVDAIQLKIKSKMESAKAMGAFATALVTFVLTQAHIYAPRVATVKGGLWAASTVLLIVAAALFFASLFQYDVLLMPIRFWASPAPSERSRRRGWVVSRPPSSSAWVLFQNMMRIWRRTFQTASLLVLLALVVLGYAVFLPDQRRGLWWAWTCVAVVLTIALIYGLCRWIRTSRPILGTQD